MRLHSNKITILFLLSFSAIIEHVQAQNVGVGTTTPAFRLDVRNGSINTDSVYRINNLAVLSVRGSQNIFVGKYAGNITTGNHNSFLGELAGYNNTTGSENSFMGYSSGLNNTDGMNNSFYGYASGAANTNGYFNSFFGAASGGSNTTGYYNSFFGLAAGFHNTSGYNNSYFGESTGYYGSTGIENSFFGKYAGLNNSIGSYNSALGFKALTNNLSGIYNTSIGYRADVLSPFLTNATAIGANSGVNCSDCLVLGSVAGFNGAASDARVGIGNIAPNFPLSFGAISGDKISLWSNSSNSYGFGIQSLLLQIHTDISSADIAFGYGSSVAFNETMRIKGNGNVGISNPAPNAPLAFSNTLGRKICLFESGLNAQYGMGINSGQLQIYSDDAAARISFGYYTGNIFYENMYLDNSTGDLFVNGTYNYSDIRLKRNIIPLHHSLEKISEINGYHYEWANKSSGTDEQTGLLAQEIQKIFPELVHEDASGLLSVNYSGLIPVLIESTKELKQQVDELRKQNDEMLLAIRQLQKKKN